jgi:hypothetical protein
LLGQAPGTGAGAARAGAAAGDAPPPPPTHPPTPIPTPTPHPDSDSLDFSPKSKDQRRNFIEVIKGPSVPSDLQLQATRPLKPGGGWWARGQPQPQPRRFQAAPSPLLEYTSTPSDGSSVWSIAFATRGDLGLRLPCCDHLAPPGPESTRW